MNVTSKAKLYLKKDPILKPLVEKLEISQWYGTGDHLLDLVEIITNQQLSYHAGKTIFSRFNKLLGSPHPQPQDILGLSDEALRSCGYSRSKVIYIKNLATSINGGELILDTLSQLNDREIISLLTAIKGIGPWTAEMFLIFSLRRPDIFSVGDLGLRTAVSRLYRVDKNDKEAILEISKKWAPFRSFACRFLWASLT